MAKKIQSSVFDNLKFNRTQKEYTAKMEHRGATISILMYYHISDDSRDAIGQLLPFAERVWKARVKHFKTFREYAVSELLEPLNGILDCGEDNPSQVTAAQLRKILTTPFSIHFFLDHDVLGFRLAGGDDPRLEECCLEAYFNEQGEVTDGEAVSLC